MYLIVWMAFDLVDVVHKLFLSSVLNSIDVGNFISWSCSSSSGTSSVKVLSSRQRFALINVWRSIVTCHWSEMLVQSFPFTCVFSEVFCVCVFSWETIMFFYVLKLAHESIATVIDLYPKDLFGHTFRILIIQFCSALWHSAILPPWMKRTVSPTKPRQCSK